VTIVELLCLEVCAESIAFTFTPSPPLATVFEVPSVCTEFGFGPLAPVLLVFTEEATFGPLPDETFGFVKDEVDAPNVEDDKDEVAGIDVEEEGIKVLLLFLVVSKELVVDDETRFELDFKFKTVDGISEFIKLLSSLVSRIGLAFVIAFVFELGAISVDLRSSFGCLFIGGLDMTLNEDGGSRCLIGIGAILSISFPFSFMDFFLSGSPYSSDSDSLVMSASSCT